MKVTTYFVGGSYELDQTGVVQADSTILISATTTRKYYSFAGQPIAMTNCTGGTCSAPTYFLTDHLGSVVAVTDSSGALVSEQRYLPFGQVRTDVGTITQTDFGYTGQRNLDAQGNAFSLGLMDYKARFYDQNIGRFVQPDSITHSGPQGLNRYSYSNNNPINYTDPTGHSASCHWEDVSGHYVQKCTHVSDPITPPGASSAGASSDLNNDYGVKTEGQNNSNEEIILEEVQRISLKLYDAYTAYCRVNYGCSFTGSPAELFHAIFGSLAISLDTTLSGACNAGGWQVINCFGDASSLSGRNIGLIAHEFGHKFDYSIDSVGSGTLASVDLITAAGETFQRGGSGWDRSMSKYQEDDKPYVQHWKINPHTGKPDEFGGDTAGEDFADMFYNWVFQDVSVGTYTLGFASNDYGTAAYNWMDARMGAWINTAIGP